MSSRVKYWISGVLVLAVIIVCVVMFAVFGDTTMPGESKITMNETYVMTSFSREGEESGEVGSDDLALREGMSKNQSVLYYSNYLYASNFKFNKDNRMTVSTAGTAQVSVYDYSQTGSKITLKPTASVLSALDFSKVDMRLKRNVLTVRYSLYGFVGVAKYSLLSDLTVAPSVSGSDFKFKSYEIAADPSSGAQAAALRKVEQTSMSTNLANTWVRFQKTANGRAMVFFVNGNTGNDQEHWEYSLGGNVVSMTQKDANDTTKDTGVFLLGSLSGVEMTVRTVTPEYSETVTFEKSAYIPQANRIETELSGSLLLQPDGKIKDEDYYGKVSWIGGTTMADTEKRDRINLWKSQGIIPDFDFDSNQSVENNIERFEAYVRDKVFTTSIIPESVTFRRSSSSTSLATATYETTVVPTRHTTGGAALGTRTFLSLLQTDSNGLWHIRSLGSGIPTLGQNKNMLSLHQVALDFIGEQGFQLPTDYVLQVPTIFDGSLTLTFNYLLNR